MSPDFSDGASGYLSQFHLHFKYHKSDVHSWKSVPLNKTCKYHKLVFVTQSILCNNSKSYRLFVEGTRAMLTSRLINNICHPCRYKRHRLHAEWPMSCEIISVCYRNLYLNKHILILHVIYMYMYSKSETILYKLVFFRCCYCVTSVNH